MASIQYTTPEGTTGEVELTMERMSIGRADDNAIIIADGSVSSHHAELTFDGASWTLTDIGSTNGTKVNGERVEQVALQGMSSFVLGSVDCVFVGDASAADTAAAYSAGAAASTSMTTDGYGAVDLDPSMRTGFGPKKKEKTGGAGALMFLGVLGLIACAAAVFMFSSLGA